MGPHRVSRDLVETVVRRDRLVVAGGLALITSLAWLYLLTGAGMDMGDMDMGDMDMGDMDMGNMDMSGMDMAGMHMAWDARYAVIMFLMWWIMMIAMMMPSAAPMILLFAAVNRRSRERDAPWVPTTFFATGYLIAWAGFSLGATAIHWSLDRSGLMTPAMASSADWLGAVLLIAAGLYQLTPLKHACLRHCRSPVAFVTAHWQPGRAGALRMGLWHGAFCVACCWVVMGLLFYGGVMSFTWIVGLSIFVLLEKLLPAGHGFGYVTGAGFIAWGLWLLATKLLA